MERYQDVSLAELLSRLVRLVRQLGADEKTYLKLAVQGFVRAGMTGIILSLAGLVLAVLSGIFLLVALTLLLNVWLPAWASALIMTGVLLTGGLALGFSGIHKVRERIEKTRVGMNRVKEDVAWLKES